jgi:type I restriction enzyme, S subunit
MSQQHPANQWQVATIGDVATVNPAKPKYGDLADSDLVGFVPMAAVDDVSGKITAAEQRPLGALRSKSYRTFAPNDVLFAKITPCMENGKSAVVPNLPNGHGFGSTEFHVIRPNDNVDPRYVWRFVRQRSYRAEAEAHMTGSVGQLRVPVDFLRQTEIPLPPIDEQRCIVERLDQIDEHRDVATAHLARTRAILTNFRLAVLTAACSGHLTKGWRECHPQEAVQPARALSPQGAKHAGGSPNTNDLVEIPDTWVWCSVEAATERVIDYRGRTPPSGATGPIPHVRTTQVRSGRIDWTTDRFVTQEVYDEYMTRGIPKQGDVLFTMEAPMGEVGVVDRDGPFSIAQRILLMRPCAGFDGGFLGLTLRSQPVQRAVEFRATGSGVLGIAYKRLRSVALPKPSLDEQREIVRRVDHMLKGSEMILARLTTASDLLDRTGRAALAKAFCGELLGGAE